MDIITQNIGTFLIIIIVLCIMILVFSIIIMFCTGKNDGKSINIARDLGLLEKNILKDSNENFIKVLTQNSDNSKRLSKELQASLDKINEVNEKKLNEIREANEKKLNLIENNINEKLDKSLNERLDNSFKTIGEQLQNLQVTNGKLISMSGTISDLQKSLSNVKVRGVFGEKQLENILNNLMSSNMYETQYRVKKDTKEMVDFAIKIPNREDDGFVYLPIDSKFPNDKYINIIKASETRDENIINAAIKDLKTAILEEAKSISEKYIEVPITTEFAIMFLPTEGLYAEVLRIDGLAETCQSNYKVLIAGPTTITAIINSFSVGFKFLQINKNSREIAKTLQAIKSQFNKFSEEIDKTKESLRKATDSTEKLESRNKMITSKLKGFDSLEISDSDKLFGIDEK